MSEHEFEAWIATLVIVGDQAFLPDEIELVEVQRRYRGKPEVRQRRAVRYRAWVERNREERRAYKRDWTRRKRAADHAEAER